MTLPFISVEKKIDRWQPVITRFPGAVADVVGKVTGDAYANSQLTVPVRRPDVEISTGVTGGFLKNSGQPEHMPGSHEGEIRYHAYYAGYVHEGTVFMESRPFLREAAESIIPSMIAVFMQLESRL